MAEVTYYFNSKSTSLWTDSALMIDGILTNYASTSSDGDTENLNGNTCPGTDLGTITKVELRAYGYGDGDDRIDLTPYATEYQLTMPASAGWSVYADITAEQASWTWALVVALDCNVEFDKSGKGNTMHCAKVEIRVTYWAKPEADIDVGSISIDRDSGMVANYTIIDKNNPANASGAIQNVKVYANTNITGLRVGTFYTTNGNTLKCRDSELVGDVEAGAERTFTELSITVVAGDYIGCYFTAGLIEADVVGFLGIWTINAEHIDPNDEATYSFADGDAISLYGYGDFAEGPTPNAYNKIFYTSEPPTPNAWNQVKQEAGTGWKKLLYT